MTGADDWRPTARLDVLAARARVLAAIRGFFAEAGVLVNAVVISRPHPDVYREII